MAKQKLLSGNKIVTTLKKMGFEKARQKGSHVVMKIITPEGSIGCVVPMHKEVAKGTLSSILRQAKITTEEFEKNL